MIKKLFLSIIAVLSILILNNSVWAKDHGYQGKIEGMVCAFCAYNVTQKISQLPGVNADSVKVDLKSGNVVFLSTLLIEKTSISKLFAESGFNLITFGQKDLNGNSIKFSSEPLISLKFSSTDIAQVDTVLDVIGDLAVTQSSQLAIKAPKTSEVELLKPILAGRKIVIKVQFIPVESNVVELKLYLEQKVQGNLEQ